MLDFDDKQVEGALRVEGIEIERDAGAERWSIFLGVDIPMFRLAARR